MTSTPSYLNKRYRRPDDSYRHNFASPPIHASLQTRFPTRSITAVPSCTNHSYSNSRISIRSDTSE